MLLPAVCIISLPYVNSNWSKSPETAKLGVDLCDLDIWPLTLAFRMDITFVHGNNSWKFHDDTMMGTWWKRCDGRTDGRWDGRTDRRTDWTSHIAAWSQLKMYRGKENSSHKAKCQCTKWIEPIVFKKNSGNFVYRRTDRHRGECSISQFHLRWSGGIIMFVFLDYV